MMDSKPAWLFEVIGWVKRLRKRIRWNVSMRLARKPPSIRIWLEKRLLTGAETVNAHVDRGLRRFACFLVTKHNAAACRGVLLVPFCVIKTLFKLSDRSVKLQILILQRRIVINERLILLLARVP